ncbi:MAG: FAD-dependent oxidoreductase [bacterium]
MSVDALIVGAGPVGMSAALSLASVGASVRVVDEQAAVGGQVYRAVDRVTEEYPDSLVALGRDYAEGTAITRLFDQSGVLFSPLTSVWDIEGGGNTRVGLVSKEKTEMVYPRNIILANGAMERPTPFPGWTLPGVMSVGGAQTLMKESGLVPEGKVVIAGSGPLVYLYANQLIASGSPPIAILDGALADPTFRHWGRLLKAFYADLASIRKGIGWLRQIHSSGVRHVRNVTDWKAIGEQTCNGVVFSYDGKSEQIECDLFLVHDGVIPNTHLSMAADCQHQWNDLQSYWTPKVTAVGESSQPGIYITGDNAGIGGAEMAACQGRVVGHTVAHRLNLINLQALRDKTSTDQRRLKSLAIQRKFLDHHYRPMKFMQVPDSLETVVCRCEEVTVGEIREVARRGCVGPNQGKAFTRCGMGPCMGRYCGNSVSQIIADTHGFSVEQVGHYRIRPPVRPINVGQLLTLD